MIKATKIIIELEDGTKQSIEGEAAVLFQVRVNSAGILAGIEVKEDDK